MDSHVQKLINEAIDNYVSEEEKQLISDWENLYKDLNESQKSHIVSILIGHGLVKKGKDGKLTKADPAKVSKLLGKIGIPDVKK